jgi:gamma-glutamyltranspeptidase/glutathione hydrolase
MLNTARATRGMVTAPHHLAAQAGLRVLDDGGNAVEAMVAAAATIAVVYPHMNGLGGDNFWLIHDPRDSAPVAIDACGAAARGASIETYRARGHRAIPTRGAEAALTVAGAVSGWQAALEVSARWGGTLGLDRLLEDAVWHAREGVAVTATQARNTAQKLAELREVPGFADTYLHAGAVPEEGSLIANAALATTLEALAARGLDDFYRGRIARQCAAALEAAGSPLREADLREQRARVVTPLELRVEGVRLYNLPPPTQGLASLLILAQYHRMRAGEADGFDHLHRLVECTKSAFLVRDREITDPRYMQREAGHWLTEASVAALSAQVNLARARPWPAPAGAGDTVWLATMDRRGRSVSMIQSLYWEFGSGLVLPEAGIVWQNRGLSFSLDPAARNPLTPGRRPFHTIQPALAVFDDGRVMPYGCMGGEGQPQSQAAVFSRYAWHGMSLQQAVTAPRWLLGRTWGEESTSLKVESRVAPEVLDALRAAGHQVQEVGPFEEIMGHAGALVRRPDGMIEGAADPRGDGVVAAR